MLREAQGDRLQPSPSVTPWNTARPLHGCRDDPDTTACNSGPLRGGESIKSGKIIVYSRSVKDQDCLGASWEASGLHYSPLADHI